MDTNSNDSRSIWLKLWLAFAVAVLVYRLASTAIWMVITLYITPFIHGPLVFLAAWEETVIIVVGVCSAVLAERWQEPYLASKSTRTNLVFGVILTPKAEPEPISDNIVS